jgi:hypothetical protein
VSLRGPGGVSFPTPTFLQLPTPLFCHPERSEAEWRDLCHPPPTLFCHQERSAAESRDLCPLLSISIRNAPNQLSFAQASCGVAKLKHEEPDLLLKMVSGAKRGDSPYSFWQVGGGYDRNVHAAKEYWGCIEYIHMNPVRKGLVDKSEDWPWTSARVYKEMPPYEFKVDRCDEWIL